MSTRKCIYCKKVKPLSEFSKMTDPEYAAETHQWYCKACKKNDASLKVAKQRRDKLRRQIRRDL